MKSNEHSNSIWGNKKVREYVADFYETMKHALPTLMAYRYHMNIFSKLNDLSGESVTNFDSDN